MDSADDPRLRSNPFATRFTRPGAIEFLFPPETSTASLVSSLGTAGWWGQIIGPHGSGKSTLVATMLPDLESAGRIVRHAALSQGERELPAAVKDPGNWTERTQLVIDGYEQLSWWNRRTIQAACRRQGAGLLVTTHVSCGLPILFQTAPSLELAQSIVRKLLADEDQTIAPADVAQAYRQHPTNLREVLFQLYDLYQNRRN